jgi:chorismate mutase
LNFLIQKTLEKKMSEINTKLESLRAKIDLADKEIVKILNERIGYALEISDVKKDLDLPVYDAEREKKVLNSIAEANDGNIPIEVIKRIFSVIIKETRGLEEIMIDEKK